MYYVATICLELQAQHLSFDAHRSGDSSLNQSISTLQTLHNRAQCSKFANCHQDAVSPLIVNTESLQIRVNLFSSISKRLIAPTKAPTSAIASMNDDCKIPLSIRNKGMSFYILLHVFANEGECL